MRTWSRDGIQSLGKPNSTKCSVLVTSQQTPDILSIPRNFAVWNVWHRHSSWSVFCSLCRRGIPRSEGDFCPGGFEIRVLRAINPSVWQRSGYLASSLHSLVDFLQEIPLPAAFGVPDGGGVGGFCDQQVRAAFIDPGSSEEREFQPKIPSNPSKTPAGNGSWSFSSQDGLGNVVVPVGNGNKASLGNSLAALIKLIQLKIGMTELENNISPVYYHIKIFTALKYSSG